MEFDLTLKYEFLILIHQTFKSLTAELKIVYTIKAAF